MARLNWQWLDRSQLYLIFIKRNYMYWKDIALTVYFKVFGRRCVLCSKLVVKEDAHLEQRDGELYLIHKQCKGLR